MLTPSYYENLCDDLIKLYGDLDNAIISDIVRRLVQNGEMTETAKWQIEQLQESGMLYEDIIAEIARRTEATQNQVRALFEDAGVASIRNDNIRYREAGLAGIIKLSPAAMQVLDAGYRKCSGNLGNLTLTTANTAQQAYITACNNAYMQISSGAFDYNTAIRNAVKAAAQDGTWVLYPSGHRDRIDVAVRRAVLTGVGQTVRQLSSINANDMDCDLMEITAHLGARPSHEEWQGKLVSLSGKKAGKIIDGCRVLSLGEIGYGSGDGFGGWNCRHDWYPFFEGISSRAYSDDDLKMLNEKTTEYDGEKYSDYEITQIQRKFERDIRGLKREAAAYDSGRENAQDEQLRQQFSEDFNKVALELKEKERQLKDFLDQTGQPRDYPREQNYIKVSYPKNSGKTLTSVENSSKIKLKDISSGISVNTKYFKGELKYYHITDERINKIKPVKLETLSDENNRKLTDACKDLLSYMKDEKLGNEGIIAFDMNMQELTRHKAIGKTASVGLPDLNEDYIIIHNHPSGLIFSESDINRFVDCPQMNILGAVGNDGSTYFISKNSKYDDYEFQEYVKEIRLNYSNKMTHEEHIKFVEEVMDNAEKYGVEFIKG